MKANENNYLTFLKLNAISKQRNQESFPQCKDWLSTDWATALAGEVGELCNLVKKFRRGELITRKDIGKELADIIIYADLFASHLGIDLEKAIIQKFNEVSERVGSKLTLP